MREVCEKFSAHALKTLEVDATRTTGYGFQIELAYRAANRGLEAVETPIVFRDRVRGTSKMSGRIVAEAMLLVTVWGIKRPFTRQP